MAGEKMETKLRAKIMEAVRTVRETNPMAGSVTNTVTMNFVANAQLAVGGSAAMVFLPDEGEFLVSAGNAVYCNVGTLLPVSRDTLPRTAKAAFEAGKVCVLDPVGIGIGSLRTEILIAVKPFKPKIIRGNASEIIALRNLWKIESSFFVNKAHQGKGYGRRAARLAIRLLKAADAAKPIKLAAERDNQRAQSLYASLGFHLLPERDGDDLVFGL